MYTDFFGLTRKPFEISPDPSFLYPDGNHKEACAALLYGIKARKGIIALTGEVGTGKTLIVRCVLDRLRSEQIEYAYVFQNFSSTVEFLHYVAEDLGVSYRPSSKADLLIQLNWHLIDLYRNGHTAILVVDEAQHLTPDILEEIRLLTNLEDANGKVLQVVLAGQPELDTILDSHELRPLKQRIAVHVRLHPLSETETQAYIEHRLNLAGNAGKRIFSLTAVHRTFTFSGGIPRLINILCDNAMTCAYSLGRSEVTCAMIEEAAGDLGLEVYSESASDGSGRLPSAILPSRTVNGSADDGETVSPTSSNSERATLLDMAQRERKGRE